MPISKPTQDLAVPWEQSFPPEKQRFDVRRICGGPGKSGMGQVKT